MVMITVEELLKFKELDKKPRQLKQKEKKTYQPKLYLNAEEKKDIIITAAFVGEWQKMILKWQGLGRSTQQIKYAKMALAFLFKTMDCIVLPLPDTEKMKLVKRAGRSKIYIEGDEI